MFESMRIVLCLDQDKMFYVCTNKSCSLLSPLRVVLLLFQRELFATRRDIKHLVFDIKCSSIKGHTNELFWIFLSYLKTQCSTDGQNHLPLVKTYKYMYI